MAHCGFHVSVAEFDRTTIEMSSHIKSIPLNTRSLHLVFAAVSTVSIPLTKIFAVVI